MALAILAEAVARIEHKIDQILTRLTFLDKTPFPQLQFDGLMCPVCAKTVNYQVDVNHGVVARKCGCVTGKLPPLTPLFPVQGVVNGSKDSDDDSTSKRRRRSSQDSGGGEEG